MAKTIALLIDTDIWIHYFNTGRFSSFFEKPYTVYYSVVTRKELLSKGGLKESERAAILFELKRHREIRMTPPIAGIYSSLRQSYPRLEKEDALIAATAIHKKLPLFTENWKHFRGIQQLRLFGG